MRVGNRTIEPETGDRRQVCGIRHAQTVRRGHHESAERRKRLCVAEHPLAPFRVEFSPGHDCGKPEDFSTELLQRSQHVLHRAFEKQSENSTWTQVIPYTDRLNYVSAMMNNVGYCKAVEELMGITIPERAKVIRVIVCEMNRIIDHLVAVGTLDFVATEAVLERSDVVVCLLPLTHHTRGLLNARTLRKIRLGGAVINVARGGHLIAEDLIKVLDSGHLAHAYLDVFEHEPLPPEHPLWRHPAITITPHTAALTEPRTAIPKIVENVERLRRGQPPLNLVDIDAGY